MSGTRSSNELFVCCWALCRKLLYGAVSYIYYMRYTHTQKCSSIVLVRKRLYAAAAHVDYAIFRYSFEGYAPKRAYIKTTTTTILQFAIYYKLYEIVYIMGKFYFFIL